MSLLYAFMGVSSMYPCKRESMRGIELIRGIIKKRMKKKKKKKRFYSNDIPNVYTGVM